MWLALPARSSPILQSPMERRASFWTLRKLKGLGWHPKIGLEDGLASTYTWFADRFAPEGESCVCFELDRQRLE